MEVTYLGVHIFYAVCFGTQTYFIHLCYEIHFDIFKIVWVLFLPVIFPKSFQTVMGYTSYEFELDYCHDPYAFYHLLNILQKKI